MKILVVCSKAPPSSMGGAETTVGELARSLTTSGHNVVIVSLEKGLLVTRNVSGGLLATYGRAKKDYSKTARFLYLRKALWHFRDIFDVRAYLGMRRVIRATEPDFVLTHLLVGLSVSVWAASANSGVPTIHTAHDYYLQCRSSAVCKPGAAPGICARYACRLQCRVSRLMAGRVEAFVGVSETMTSILQISLKLSKDQCHTVEPKVSPHQAVDARPSELAAPIRFGYLGRLSPEKGVTELALSFAEQGALRASIPSELHIAGDGPCMALLQDLKTKDKSIAILGHQEAYSFLKNVDILMVPSLWLEPYGRIVGEAAIAGVPTVCFAHGGPFDQLKRFTCGVTVAGNFDELWSAAFQLAVEPAQYAAARVACAAYAHHLSLHLPGERYSQILLNHIDGPTK